MHTRSPTLTRVNSENHTLNKSTAMALQQRLSTFLQPRSLPLGYPELSASIITCIHLWRIFLPSPAYKVESSSYVHPGLGKIDCNRYSIAIFLTFFQSNTPDPLLFGMSIEYAVFFSFFQVKTIFDFFFSE